MKLTWDPLRRTESLDDETFHILQSSFVSYIQSEYIFGPAESSAQCMHIFHQFPFSIKFTNDSSSHPKQILAYIRPLLPRNLRNAMDILLHRHLRPHPTSVVNTDPFNIISPLHFSAIAQSPCLPSLLPRHLGDIRRSR